MSEETGSNEGQSTQGLGRDEPGAAQAAPLSGLDACAAALSKLATALAMHSDALHHLAEAIEAETAEAKAATQGEEPVTDMAGKRLA